MRQYLFGIALIVGVGGAICCLVNTGSDLKVTKPSGPDYCRQELQVSSFTASTQGNSAVALDRHGGSVVVWDSRRQQKGTYGIYMQRFAPTGDPIGFETPVNLYTKNMQMLPSVAVSKTGDIWVAWQSFGQDGSLSGIIARRFEAGTSLGSDEILVNQRTAGQQGDVVIAPNSNGNVTFIWTTPMDDGRQAVVARRFDRSGKPLEDEWRIATSEHTQKLPAVAVDSEHRMVAVWAESDDRGRPMGIFGRVFADDRSPVTDVLAISPDDGQAHIEPSVDVAAHGGFVVAWLATTDREYAVNVRSFNKLGIPSGSPRRIGQLDAQYVHGAAVATADDGRFFVTWNQLVGPSSSDNIDIRGQFFNAAGQLEGSEFCVNQYRQGCQRLTGASGKRRVDWGADRLALVWNGESPHDKTSANLTMFVPETTACQLVGPRNKPAAVSQPTETAAQPHEPPSFNAKNRIRDPFGGDRQPAPQTGEFGFIGITSTGWTPPDPSLAVGPNQLVAMTNGAIAFFDKDGTLTFQDEIENSFGFWGSLGADNFVFDPEVIFDPHSNRFFAMACERSDDSRSFFLLAVSDDDNPNGNWFKYRLDVTPLAGNDIDSPNMAVDDQAVYLTADFFGPDKYLIYILDKADLLVGNQPDTRDLLITGSQSMGIPVTYDSNAPALYMIHAGEFGTFSSVDMHAITDPLGSPQRVTTSVNVPSYGHPVDPVQMGTSVRPELFEARFWSCMYRNGSLWAVHHQSPNSTGVVRARWYEFDMNGWPTSGNQPFLVQSGDITPGGSVATFFPSIWADDQGNAVVTCARSSPSEFISMSRALRKGSDPMGHFDPLEFVRESTTAYVFGRWGDYSGTMNDPSAPGTFWGVHEYAISTTSWNTWIGQFVIDGPVCSGNGVLIEGAGEVNDFNAACGSDDNYWAAHGDTLAFRITDPVTQFELTATAPIGFGGGSISIDIEASKENANGNLNVRALLYNFVTEDYEALPGVLALDTADLTQTFDLPGGADPNDFIEPGTNDVRLLIQTIQTSGLANVRTQLDQVVFNF